MQRSLILLLFMLGLTEVQANVFVHLFEWRWNDVAEECENFLGQHDYTAVQISPPNEHRMLLGRPWYERYQPISYRLESRSGSRDELAQMIARCHGVGVKVYADVVINHMASCRPECDRNQPQFGNAGVAGSSYQPGGYRFESLFDDGDRFHVPGSLNAYGPEHFHRNCPAVQDWGNVWQLHNCELEGLADLATERNDVRATLANYLASLFALGVDGLRIDAAKHLPPSDLRAILTMAAQAANVRIEGTSINAQAPKSVVVFQEYIGNPPDPYGAYGNGKVTEFSFGIAQSTAFLNWDGLKISQAASLISQWKMQPSYRVVTFIDNHDNQRGHGGGGKVFAHKGGNGRNYGIRNYLPAYRLANIFMLAVPYGYPKVMSSYAFGNGELWDKGNPMQDILSVAGMQVRDDFLGPPHMGQHKQHLSESDYAA
ncbi:MAG: alpha-amylase family glycosyl hydrolase, partial [Candidatus Thiodiazotropha sp.]